MRRAAVALLGLTAFAAACSRPLPPAPPSPPLPAAPGGAVEPGWQQEGVASWYGHPFHGRQTASGEVYDMERATAAHPSLPFGTVIQVDNLDNGRSTELRVNDRGPFVGGRILDVSRFGARELGMLGPGTARVRVLVRQAPPPPRDCWTVQVGSFAEADNARRLRDDLAAEGWPVRIERGGGGLHRVLAGPLVHVDAQPLARRYRGVLYGCGPVGGHPGLP